MRRWLPYTALSASLMVVWLLLNQTLAPRQFLLGALLGASIAAFVRRLELPPVQLRRAWCLLGLAARVGVDIVRSNFAVASIIVTPRRRAVTSGFVAVPLELEDRYGLAILACIITSTPGTLWVSYDRSEGVLLIHVLDLIDEAQWIADIKRRYEQPLLSVFA